MVQSLYKRDYYDADSHLATGGPSLLWRQNGMNHVQVHIRIKGGVKSWFARGTLENQEAAK